MQTLADRLPVVNFYHLKTNSPQEDSLVNAPAASLVDINGDTRGDKLVYVQEEAQVDTVAHSLALLQ